MRNGRVRGRGQSRGWGRGWGLLLALSLVWGVGLSACSQQIPVAQIPVPPGASSAEAQTLGDPTEQLLAALEQPVQRAATGSQVTHLRYLLPQQTSPDSLITFYTDALKDNGWQRTPQLTRPIAPGSPYARLAYQRGRGASEQVLLLNWVRSPELAQPILLVILVSNR